MNPQVRESPSLGEVRLGSSGEGGRGNPWAVVRSVSGGGKTGLDYREGMLRREGLCPAYARGMFRSGVELGSIAIGTR